MTAYIIERKNRAVDWVPFMVPDWGYLIAFDRKTIGQREAAFCRKDFEGEFRAARYEFAEATDYSRQIQEDEDDG